MVRRPHSGNLEVIAYKSEPMSPAAFKTDIFDFQKIPQMIT